MKRKVASAMKKKIVYIATFGGSGVYARICHRSKTEAAARKNIERCEAIGGASHNLYRAVLLPRKKKP